METIPTSTPSTPLYDLTGLRAQILANGSILVPGLMTAPDQHAHLELVVVKREYSSAPPRTVTTTTPASNKLNLAGSTTTAKVSETKRQMSEAKGLWYATLLKRTGSGTALRVVIKGPGEESVGRALEAVLEESAKRVDRLIRAYARDV